MSKNKGFKEMMDKLWPKTQREIEKAVKHTKKALKEGEKYLKEFSEKGAKETKKLSLSLKKEKLYYDLGKTVAKTAVNKCQGNKRIAGLKKQIKDLEKEIKNIK